MERPELEDRPTKFKRATIKMSGGQRLETLS